MPVPVLSVEQMRAWEEATWAAGQTAAAVIAGVGRAVAARACELTQPGDRLLLLAGRGHNGDDVRAARDAGPDRVVEVIDITDPTAARAGVEAALGRRPALVVDGLFGIGLNRPLDDGWCGLIRQVRESGVPVLAVDVPSGLNAATGRPEGEAIRATVTLTVGAPKSGLLKPEAVPFVGRLEVADRVGLTASPVSGDLWWTVASDFSGFPPDRPVASNKGSFGHLAILAGSLGWHGAAVLAARGAQRARPGLITLRTQPEAYLPIASQLQSVMVQPWTGEESFDRYSAVMAGPGLALPTLAANVRHVVRRLWCDAELPVIIDASALDWIPPHPTPHGALRVITPHPGEAARLLHSSVAEVQADRVGAVRELSSRWQGCWVVLKGHQTLVGRSTGEIFVNPSGSPSLAQGGSGDLLAGYLAGLLAQPALQADPARVIRYAVWAHGVAADALDLERPNWIVEELTEALGGVRSDGSRWKVA